MQFIDDHGRPVPPDQKILHQLFSELVAHYFVWKAGKGQTGTRAERLVTAGELQATSTGFRGGFGAPSPAQAADFEVGVEICHRDMRGTWRALKPQAFKVTGPPLFTVTVERYEGKPQRVSRESADLWHTGERVVFKLQRQACPPLITLGATVTVAQSGQMAVSYDLQVVSSDLAVSSPIRLTAAGDVAWVLEATGEHAAASGNAATGLRAMPFEFRQEGWLPVEPGPLPPVIILGRIAMALIGLGLAGAFLWSLALHALQSRWPFEAVLIPEGDTEAMPIEFTANPGHTLWNILFPRRSQRVTPTSMVGSAPEDEGTEGSGETSSKAIPDDGTEAIFYRNVFGWFKVRGRNCIEVNGEALSGKPVSLWWPGWRKDEQEWPLIRIGDTQYQFICGS